MIKNEHWTEGDWKLLIATGFCNGSLKASYSFVQDALGHVISPIKLEDIEVVPVNWKEQYIIRDSVWIK